MKKIRIKYYMYIVTLYTISVPFIFYKLINTILNDTSIGLYPTLYFIFIGILVILMLPFAIKIRPTFKIRKFKKEYHKTCDVRLFYDRVNYLLGIFINDYEMYTQSKTLKINNDLIIQSYLEALSQENRITELIRFREANETIFANNKNLNLIYQLIITEDNQEKAQITKELKKELEQGYQNLNQINKKIFIKSKGMSYLNYYNNKILFFEGEYHQYIINEKDTIENDNLLNVLKSYYLGVAYYHIDDYSNAIKQFNYVVNRGNNLYTVTNTKEYIELINQKST